jgi:Sec-independent protein secretion pathway component TatC
MCLLYELGVLAVRLFVRRNRAHDETTA